MVAAQIPGNASSCNVHHHGYPVSCVCSEPVDTVSFLEGIYEKVKGPL